MPRTTKVPEADARNRILAAAAEVFASIGYAGARVDDIAERAGINKAMLYYHVGDKEALYTTVLSQTIDSAVIALQSAIDPRHTPDEKMQAVIEAFARLGDENRVFIPVVLREIASGGAHLPDEILMKMAGIFRLVSGVIAEGIADGSFRQVDLLLTHVTIVGATMFLVGSAPVRKRVSKIAGIPMPDESAQRLAAHLTNLLLHGLEADAPAVKKRNKRSR